MKTLTAHLNRIKIISIYLFPTAWKSCSSKDGEKTDTVMTWDWVEIHFSDKEN